MTSNFTDVWEDKRACMYDCQERYSLFSEKTQKMKNVREVTPHNLRSCSSAVFEVKWSPGKLISRNRVAPYRRKKARMLSHPKISRDAQYMILAWTTWTTNTSPNQLRFWACDWLCYVNPSKHRTVAITRAIIVVMWTLRKVLQPRQPIWWLSPEKSTYVIT